MRYRLKITSNSNVPMNPLQPQQRPHIRSHCYSLFWVRGLQVKRSTVVVVRSETSALRFIWGPGKTLLPMWAVLGRLRLGDIWDSGFFGFFTRKAFCVGVCFPKPLTFNSWLPALPLMSPPPTFHAWDVLFLTESSVCFIRCPVGCVQRRIHVNHFSLNSNFLLKSPTPQC